MSNPLSIDNIAFTILGYPMSYVELVGTVCYLCSVWLIAKRKVLTWPIGIVSVLLYMALFYQIHLYSDALEQVYYLIVSVYGWWHWLRSPREEGTVIDVGFTPARTAMIWLAVTIVVGVLVGALMSRIHNLLPSVFSEPASYPYVDALTTIGSFAAMWLMARRRVESWLYWIVIDLAGIVLYYLKSVRFVALLYVVLLMLAIKGFLDWKASRRQATTG